MFSLKWGNPAPNRFKGRLTWTDTEEKAHLIKRATSCSVCYHSNSVCAHNLVGGRFSSRNHASAPLQTPCSLPRFILIGHISQTLRVLITTWCFTEDHREDDEGVYELHRGGHEVLVGFGLVFSYSDDFFIVPVTVVASIQITFGFHDFLQVQSIIFSVGLMSDVINVTDNYSMMFNWFKYIFIL